MEAKEISQGKKRSYFIWAAYLDKWNQYCLTRLGNEIPIPVRVWNLSLTAKSDKCIPGELSLSR